VTDRYTLCRNNPGVFLGQPFYDWRKHVFEELVRHLRARGIDVTIEDRIAFEIRPYRAPPRVITILDSLAILENDCTGDYMILDCHDNVRTEEVDLFARDQRCTRILKCQYRAELFQGPGYEKVLPWTYFDRFWPSNDDLLVSARQAERHLDRLYFRGADWGRRARILAELQRRDLTNPDFGVVDYADYLRESTDYRIVLSLPGMADFCNRDVEWFGGGACVLRPRMINDVYNELVPDYHYVSIDMNYWGHSPAVVADRIEQRFREVIGDPDYLRFVATNAARWYDANVRVTPAMELTIRQLGFDPARQAPAPTRERRRGPEPSPATTRA